jgi:hypothetical protein
MIDVPIRQGAGGQCEQKEGEVGEFQDFYSES